MKKSQLRLVLSNQRGGVGKTTSAVTLARCFAETGKKVLLLDTDPQGSVSSILGLRPSREGANLNGLLVHKLALRECTTPAHPNIDVVCSDKFTNDAEAKLMTEHFREHALKRALERQDDAYDVVIADVSPSISLLQACAMIYARNIIVPIDMDMLSVQGALASFEAVGVLNELQQQDEIRVLGLLPTKVNPRLAMTEVVLNSVAQICSKHGVQQFRSIRTDQAVFKASAGRKFLHDFDPHSRALEDYVQVTDEIVNLIAKGESGAHVEAKSA